MAHITSVTLHHAAVSVAVTSFTTAAAFFVNYVNDVIDIRCFGIFSGICILSNLFLMVTWMPTVLILSERMWYGCYPWLGEIGKYSIAHWCTVQCKTTRHWMSYFYEAFYNLFIDRFWFVWLFILPILGLAGGIIVFVKPKLQLPQSNSLQLFPSYDYMEQWDIHIKTHFQYAIDADKTDDIKLYFIWGVKPVDNSAWSNPSDHGTLEMDRGFNISSPAAQIWMLKFCHELSHLNYTREPITCTLQMIPAIITQCKQHLTQLPVEFTSLCCESSVLPMSSRQYEICVAAAMSCPLTQTLLSRGINDATLYDNNNKPSVYTLKVKTNQPYTPSYKIMGDFYRTVNSLFKSQISSAPDGLKNGFMTSPDFEFYDLQYSLSHGTYYSIGLSLSVALVVMFVTTLNPLITVYAMITISMAIAVTVAFIVFLGWHLGILESVVLNLAVGLSIDFTIHYGVAYCTSKEYSSIDKTRDTFMRVGGAVAMAALTTFMAGVAILPSYIIAYNKMGIFLMLVMTMSWVYSTFFFLSLCRVLAPRGTFCQLSIPWRRCCSLNSPLDNNADQHSLRSVESDDSFLLTF